MQVRGPNGSGEPVVIVADSATDPPEGLVRELGILLVPIYIRFGEETLRDRVDITVEQVMARLSRGELAKTANPGPADFLQAFRRALDQAPGATILCFCISARLSGGYQSALVAKQMLGYPHIHVVDTRGGSLASGWVVIEAARAARRGEPAERILERAESMMGRMRFYAALDDLRHLYHTGRLGRAQVALGTLLDIKPILTIREGEVALVERVRSRNRAMQRLLSLASEGLEGKSVKCAVFYTGDEEPAEWLSRELAHRMCIEELIRVHAGPVITAAVGPGLVGFALFPIQGEEN